MKTEEFGRRARQLRRVARALRGGKWMTLRRLATETRDPEASISARIRDLKARGWTITKRRKVNAFGVASGLFEYRGTPS